MKKRIPGLLAALMALFLLSGCDGEKDKPINDGKTPESIKASKKADEGQ